MKTKHLNLISFLILLVIWAFSIYKFTITVGNVPIHWGLYGEPNLYTGRWGVFIIPVVSTFTCLLLYWVQKHPEFMNIPGNLDESSKGKAQELAIRLCSKMNVLMMLMFACIGYFAHVGNNKAIIVSTLCLALICIALPFHTIWKILKMRNEKA